MENTVLDVKLLAESEKYALYNYSVKKKYIPRTYPFDEGMLQNLIVLLGDKGESIKDILNDYWDARAEGQSFP